MTRAEFDEAIAIWMTASMSSFVGPEPACGDDLPATGAELELEEGGLSLGVEEEEFRVDERAGRVCVAEGERGD